MKRGGSRGYVVTLHSAYEGEFEVEVSARSAAAAIHWALGAHPGCESHGARYDAPEPKPAGTGSRKAPHKEERQSGDR